MFNRTTHWRFFVGLAIALLLHAWPPAANAEKLRYSLVSRETVENRLSKYAGDNAQREATLKQMFVEVGCGDHLSEQVVKGSKLPNVVCVLPGGSDTVIIVGASFDRLPKVDGVVNNWSGACLLPSLYQTVKTDPRKHTYIFIGFTDGMTAQVGSHFYVQQLTKEQIAKTDAMVNIDTLGLGPTQVWSSHSDKLLIGALNYVARSLNAPISRVDIELTGSSTDSEQFAARKIPRITIHSLTQKLWDAGIIFTSKDKISAMRLDDYYQTYELLAAYLTFLDRIVRGPAGLTLP
jgi:hypothetical protein